MKFEQLTGLQAREAGYDEIQWPPDAVVIYAIDDQGIAGRTAWIELGHIEGTEVREDKRGSSLAARLVAMLEQKLREHGRSHIFAFIEDDKPEVASYMERFGYTKFPVTVWAKKLINATEELTEQQMGWIARGAEFHEQLTALDPSHRHLEDVDHYLAVGQCLEIAIDQNDPVGALAFYNDLITNGAPYQPITLVSADATGITIDMGEHGRVRLDSTGTVQQEALCQ